MEKGLSFSVPSTNGKLKIFHPIWFLQKMRPRFSPVTQLWELAVLLTSSFRFFMISDFYESLIYGCTIVWMV